MQTKSATESFMDSQLEYLNGRPLLKTPSIMLDKEWLEMMIKGSENVENTMLSLKDKGNLPNKLSVLILFQLFRNNDKYSNSLVIADKVVKEIKKYWARSNIPIQTNWWIKRSILSLNTEYQKLLKNL